jgi:hypothetical protein
MNRFHDAVMLTLALSDAEGNGCDPRQFWTRFVAQEYRACHQRRVASK